MSLTTSPRVAAIGLDAAEWSLIERMLADGQLPHLASLQRRSATVLLDNSTEYRTGLVWEHFLTGRGSAGNRRWSAVQFEPDTYHVWKKCALNVPPFYVDTPPVTTVSFDVPYTNLSHAAPGAQVAAWGGHDSAYPRSSSPPGLLREIDRRFGVHPGFLNDYDPMWHRANDIDDLVDGLVVGSRRRADASLWLLSQVPDWELFLTVLSEPHSAGEQLWHGVDPEHPLASATTAEQAGRRLMEVYRAVDDAVGRLIAGLPPDCTVMVFSMFGMGSNDADIASMVLLPELLHRLYAGQSLLRDPDTARWKKTGCPPLLLEPDETWHNRVSGQLRRNHPAWRQQLGRATPSWLKDIVRSRSRSARAPREGTPGALGKPIGGESTAPPDVVGTPSESVMWQIACRYRHAWPQVPAFALPTFYDGRVRLNVRGRERDGTVEPEDYEKMCAEIEDELRACRNPRSGEPIVAAINRPRAAAPLEPDGPDADLEVVWRGAPDALEHPRVGTIGPIPYRRTGGHRPGGFAFVAGPGIAPGDLGSRLALDVAPTVLALLGRERRDDIVGEPFLAAARPTVL